MCRYIDITKDEYYKEIKKYENDIKTLQILSNQSKVLRYFIFLLFFQKFNYYLYSKFSETKENTYMMILKSLALNT